MLSEQQAALYIQNLISIAILIDAAEILFMRRQYSLQGIYSYQIVRSSHKWVLSGVTGNLFGFIFSYPRFIYLILFQALAAVMVLSQAFGGLTLILLIALIFFIKLSANMRHQTGLDGADQMQVIVLAGLVGFYLFDDQRIQTISLIFISAQSILSYLVSGVAKLLSKEWRSGEAIKGIMNTVGYGNKKLAKVFTSSKSTSKLACWSVIIVESFFPFFILINIDFTFIFLIVVGLMHLSIAIVMHLNNFFWSFISTYPAVIYLSYLVHQN
ncbi:hypothetical protein BFP97_07480 [Roseivirga sp. 4D4]|uniref:hypothetical protein n=1 Tax=Roseivirga sp. 4D4 TaxID=1889784 RepID=UPI000853D9AC|nr:hypothetical protein [Roseivirga sp. 4D4]OEK01366.1 hypothetical protein BFP97_07480 [Roseivirga sp. 4D4]